MDMKLIKSPTEADWTECKRRALITMYGKGLGDIKPPTPEWKHKILAARHSPIRYLMYSFLVRDIPSNISVHFARHVHAQPYVSSLRNDRQDAMDGDAAPRNTPVNMIYDVNAEELMVIANKRLCNKASKQTREATKMMCKLALEATPELEGLLVPMCEYRGGLCDEFNSCGRCDSIRAQVAKTHKGSTVEISVSADVYARAGRILLRQEDSNYGTMFYPDEV